jgi:hypothetical protein
LRKLAFPISNIIPEKMEESKPDISQVETAPVENKHSIAALAVNEDEPQTPYQLGWRTILAVLTLSMGNVCAALSNTVSPLEIPLSLIADRIAMIDKYHY